MMCVTMIVTRMMIVRFRGSLRIKDATNDGWPGCNAFCERGERGGQALPGHAYDLLVALARDVGIGDSGVLIAAAAVGVAGDGEADDKGIGGVLGVLLVETDDLDCHACKGGHCILGVLLYIVWGFLWIANAFLGLTGFLR
jgi:hypothetical protein